MRLLFCLKVILQPTLFISWWLCHQTLCWALVWRVLKMVIVAVFVSPQVTPCTICPHFSVISIQLIVELHSHISSKSPAPFHPCTNSWQWKWGEPMDQLYPVVSNLWPDTNMYTKEYKTDYFQMRCLLFWQEPITDEINIIVIIFLVCRIVWK